MIQCGFVNVFREGTNMRDLNIAIGPRHGMAHTPTSFSLRLGNREMHVSRDFRNRYYKVNPIIDCSTGLQRGHVELLVMRKWLVILSKAH
jgi:hypothetical protein